MDSNVSGLESDPQFYKRNSVMGSVTSGGAAVPGATITIVKTGERHAADETGTFVIVLDPDSLGTRQHELVFSAPGFVEQRQTVYVPVNKQVRLDVDLVSAD